MAINHKILTKSGVQEKTLTPMAAIRAKCQECSNFQYSEIQRCPVADCALFPYRLGRRPGETEIINKTAVSVGSYVLRETS